MHWTLWPLVVSLLAGPVATRPAPIINHVLTNQKVVALTFDDGPTRTWTPKVLQVLKKDHVRATFFVVGSHAERRPEILTEEIRDGMEIGSHGYQHITLKGKDAATVEQEIQQNQALLQSLGAPKPTLYRLPGGASDTVARQVLGKLGYRVIGWSIDTRDWRHRYTGAEMAQHVEKDISPGAIIIFHDGPNSSQATVDAVEQIIPALEKAGYRFDTVSHLLKLERVPAIRSAAHHHRP
ncbi:polysaccharide deacetylase [Sulfobacillus acidophilus TPY]|uniref:Polysaccharide deacetylase n=1 Tax=Sulfobacillus acidophilus (strain ATCC 700253 / DSM 10332 / NAL) TaxID=679936 RepID=G8TVD6_SULAD|nr:polysaccharide deacetylase [Sulfobacillus acidophilus TPY]AEW05855.1 polysaccharide deacetylase [Sulfobacillus acidophilus DSM 10332]